MEITTKTTKSYSEEYKAMPSALTIGAEASEGSYVKLTLNGTKFLFTRAAGEQIAADLQALLDATAPTIEHTRENAPATLRAAGFKVKLSDGAATAYGKAQDVATLHAGPRAYQSPSTAADWCTEGDPVLETYDEWSPNGVKTRWTSFHTCIMHLLEVGP